MGFINTLFWNHKKIEDDFFGNMSFSEYKNNPQKNHFQCIKNFTPTGDPIKLNICGDFTGPTQKQKDFYLEIENKYICITENLAPVIEEYFKNWDESFMIHDFHTEFAPIRLEISRCIHDPIDWSISFESLIDVNSAFTLAMSGFGTHKVIID